MFDVDAAAKEAGTELHTGIVREKKPIWGYFCVCLVSWCITVCEYKTNNHTCYKAHQMSRLLCTILAAVAHPRPRRQLGVFCS